ncbi:MAG: gamma-glutamylcyclotransferase family protein [Gordonia sp. (in: high G+C Gram-positive bacteria)]|uniref:gamma-glutamylcyclotransferase family protein n=1 Tax=Gordonia sp. (in: high G+C Gram-positive bacteria) TaxID=84139 RepID=UPI0039E2DC53
MTHRLFSYGTLRQPEVQAALFGRSVPTVDDALPGYRIEWLTITDPEVIATSGSDRHPILREGSPDDAAPGAYLELDDAELKAADDYEVDDYVRTAVTLASGVDAWAYLAADES